MKIEEFGNTVKIIADEGKIIYNISTPSVNGKEFVLGCLDKIENYGEKDEENNN